MVMKAGALEVFKIRSSILDEKQAQKVVEYIENINETEIIKWTFVFWITQTLTILGVAAYFIK